MVPSGVEYLDHGDFISLRPVETGAGSADHGIIFYPGGLVQPEAYVSMLAPLAANGTPVAIARVVANLAVFSPNRAESILEGDLGAAAETWTLAGHSLGGAMAARFMARSSGRYPNARGLILMASYPAESDSLAETDTPVLSIWATNDGLATPDDRRDTASRLPRDAVFAVIQGGNHAGFGEYGPQSDDGERSISLQEQHRQVRRLVTDFLERL
jgi:dienelactone hydrolase